MKPVSRDPNRIPVTLKHIERIWSQHPDLRLSQLILNFADLGDNCPKLYYMEDDELLKSMGVKNPTPVRGNPEESSP
ncbi:hypothetical protein N9916_00120 [Akkermansiaceae bacterium]|nr:hypothetical protein [Akkermansiaceae bacterium]MDB4282429.1 hypothetical protein [Akkermansiaceae bacterium]MDB4318746.1 hypothetical protein [Akkermansiaceae bacterium]MDB4451720.1 hypothetical protein [Akkermansiaceae bacterium]MDB4693491.1 hypothetical protein [Akkermansiaceae bacterium]